MIADLEDFCGVIKMPQSDCIMLIEKAEALEVDAHELAVMILRRALDPERTEADIKNLFAGGEHGEP